MLEVLANWLAYWWQVYSNPATMFLSTGWISYFLIRFFADILNVRLYIPSKVGTSVTKRVSADKKVHIHHFVFGMALMPVVMVALWFHYWLAPAFAGVQLALIGSETKELLYQHWKK